MQLWKYAALAPWLPAKYWEKSIKRKVCRKETRRRFKTLRGAVIPAETLALGLLERRCAVCPHNCWGPGR